MPTMFSSRVSASRGVLAWTVVIEPSWPVFMACSMSKRLGAAHLAEDDAVGPHAQAVLHQVALVTSPLPSMLGGRVSSRTTCGCCSCSSAASSMVTMRSRPG
jgi:hypothetical protein